MQVAGDKAAIFGVGGGVSSAEAKAEAIGVTARTKLKLRDTTKYIEEY
jgi:hypothetical protein